MRWSILIISTMWLAMCGQKGPLYLPEKTALAEGSGFDYRYSTSQIKPRLDLTLARSAVQDF